LNFPQYQLASVWQSAHAEEVMRRSARRASSARSLLAPRPERAVHRVIATIAGLLIVVIAILPGVLGNLAYRALAGVSWREKEAQQILRLLAFSASGLAAYTFMASWLSWPLPEYVVPNTFAAGNLSAVMLPGLAAAYVGHFVFATAVGILAGFVVSGLRKLRPGFGQRDAWDQFIHGSVPRRWVIVHLRSGESYAGFIDHADVSVEPAFRDLILREPYRWNEEAGTYDSTYNQYLFLQGSEVVSIAVVHDPLHDRRVVPAGETPFRGVSDAEREAHADDR
jgi:hypothetical protein